MTYKLRITETALGQLKKIDPRIRAAIIRKIEELRTDPEKRGKALRGPLFGYYALRAAGQRYRIIYAIENREIVVIVVTVGIRKEGDKKDVYALMKKLVETGLLERENDD